MDIETVAELLDVSPRQIRIYVAQSGLPDEQGRPQARLLVKEVLNWYVGYRFAIRYGERPSAQS